MRRSTIETLCLLRRAERGSARRDQATANAIEAAAAIAYNTAVSIGTDEAACALSLDHPIYRESNFLMWRESYCDHVVVLERVARDARRQGQTANVRLAEASVAFEVALMLQSTAAEALVERRATETTRDLDALLTCRHNGPEAGGGR